MSIRLRKPLLVIAAAAGLLGVSCGSGVSTSPASQSSPAAAVATASSGFLPAGHGQPPQSQQVLVGDQTGGTAWVEYSCCYAKIRVPRKTGWILEIDEGIGTLVSEGIPGVRVTNAATGHARVYNLVTGELVSCRDGSVVTNPDTAARAGLPPVSEGRVVDCSVQPLSSEEVAVFGHVLVTQRKRVTAFDKKLPGDQTGGVPWEELHCCGGASIRIPDSAAQASAEHEQGVKGETAWLADFDEALGAARDPTVRITDVRTGQARLYNLRTGQTTCSERFAVRDDPTKSGNVLDCARQPLTPTEAAVFAHVVVTAPTPTLSIPTVAAVGVATPSTAGP